MGNVIGESTYCICERDMARVFWKNPSSLNEGAESDVTACQAVEHGSVTS